MFSMGSVTREEFLRHIDEHGADWRDTIVENGIPTHIFMSVGWTRVVHMTMPFDEIPKETALDWLRQLEIK